MSECEVSNEAENTGISKKPFNKKKWREQKYSCKAKVQKWERFKRKQAQRQFNKEFKKLQGDHKPADSHPKEMKSISSFKQAKMQYEHLQKIKEEKRKEQERIRKERFEALQAYKERKVARYKKLSQKTRKGQPLMRGRIELLLEEIQKKFVNQDS